MIGKLLATASVVEEDRVLCTVMRPGSYWEYDRGFGDSVLRGPCLVGTMLDYQETGAKPLDRIRFGSDCIPSHNIESRYDTLCKRFGEERINTLIRNRILDNRVKKALKGVRSNEQRTLAECG